MRDTKQRKEMKRENCKALLPIMKAYAEGKTIEVKNLMGKWEELPEPKFDNTPEKYRVKAEKEYRPFKNEKECWEEMLKHQPFGWIKDEYKYVHIVCVHKNKIEFSPDEDDNGTLFTSTMDFTSVYEKGGYTFADGTPFGIREE